MDHLPPTTSVERFLRCAGGEGGSESEESEEEAKAAGPGERFMAEISKEPPMTMWETAMKHCVDSD